MRKRRILLVDDDPNTTYILGMMLKLNGFDVYPYTDPEAALASFRRGQFDLLLLDVRIPAMNGFELYRKIRYIDEKIDVCFMTNYSKEYVQEFTKSFPELGHNHLVEKPAAAADLLKIVDGYFGH
jgi:CheY-like chemotaxis protein